MPKYLQGDIFTSLKTYRLHEHSYDLAVIIGHCGLNIITTAFRSWLCSNKEIGDSLGYTDNPFPDPFALVGPHEYSAKRYIWFFKDENGAMSDATLRAAMENSASWASNNGLKNIIINGIKNIDGTNDDIQRIEFMTALASDLERKYNIIFTLISTDESFIASK